MKTWDDDLHKTRPRPEKRTKNPRKPLVKAAGDTWWLHVDKKGVEWHVGLRKYLPKMRVEVIAVDDSNVIEVTFRRLPPVKVGQLNPKRRIRRRAL